MAVAVAATATAGATAVGVRGTTTTTTISTTAVAFAVANPSGLTAAGLLTAAAKHREQVRLVGQSGCARFALQVAESRR